MCGLCREQSPWIDLFVASIPLSFPHFCPSHFVQPKALILRLSAMGCMPARQMGLLVMVGCLFCPGHSQTSVNGDVDTKLAIHELTPANSAKGIEPRPQETGMRGHLEVREVMQPRCCVQSGPHFLVFPPAWHRKWAWLRHPGCKPSR
jgi:hypothetical protein